MKNIIQYLPFMLIVIGMISIFLSAFIVATSLGFFVIGIGLFTLAYILTPKGANL